MMEKKRLSHAEIIVIVLIVGALLAILLPALARHRESKRRSACVGNLTQLSIALHLYAEENKNRYPPIDNKKNNFTFDANLLYPEYLSDHMAAVCPGDRRWDPDSNFRLVSNHPADGTPKGEVHPDCFTDDSCIYLGWMVMTDKEVEALFETYDALQVEDYDTNMTVPEGWGTLEGDTIHRLSAGVDRFLIKDFNSIASFKGVGSSTVPMVWDRPYGDTTKVSHQPGAGGNVLYLDGHVEHLRIEDTKVWYYNPITETMARLLEERPRERIPGCDE